MNWYIVITSQWKRNKDVLDSGRLRILTILIKSQSFVYNYDGSESFEGGSFELWTISSTYYK